MPEVHFIGEMEGALGLQSAAVFAKWRIDAHAPHWRVVDGHTTGRTWLAERREPRAPAVWNEPLACAFSTAGVAGWPSLLVEVFTADGSSRVDVGGYGVVRLPTAPGAHCRDVALFRPRGSLLSHVAAKFLGGHPRYTDAAALYSSAPRFGHRTESVGSVRLSLSVVVKGFDRATLPHVRLAAAAAAQLHRDAWLGKAVHTETMAGDLAEIAQQGTVCGRCPAQPQYAAAHALDEKGDEGGAERGGGAAERMSVAEAVQMALQKEMEEIENKVQTNLAANAAAAAAAGTEAESASLLADS